MNNREKVIKDFESEIMNFTPACTSDELLKEVMETALELLKEQEPVEPLIADYKIYGSNRICANCTAYLFPAGKYCPGCGREVKWDD